MPDHQIELVAIDHEIAACRRGFVKGVIGEQLDAAEIDADIVAQELVMVAGEVDEARALPGPALSFCTTSF